MTKELEQVISDFKYKNWTCKGVKDIFLVFSTEKQELGINLLDINETYLHFYESHKEDALMETVMRLFLSKLELYQVDNI